MSAPARAWRDGAVLVLGKQAVLPGSCTRCGRSVPGSALHKKLSWHHPALYLLLLNPPLYAITALAIRKRAAVRLPVCGACLARRRRALLLGPLLLCCGVAALSFGLAENSAVYGLLGLFVAMGSCVWAVVDSFLLTVVGIDEHHVRARGAHAKLLAQLPEWSA